MHYVSPVQGKICSQAVLQRVLQAKIAKAELWHLVRQLRQITARPIYCTYHPLQARAPRKGVFFAYKDVQAMIGSLTQDLDVRLLPQPPETRVQDLFAAPEFTNGSLRLRSGKTHPDNDLSHMNSAYGALCLTRLREELQTP